MFWLAEVFNGSYSEQEIKQMERWARRRRAEAVHALLSGIGRGVASAARGAGRAVAATGRGLAAAYGRHQRRRRQRAAIRELSALGDRILRDIGIERGEIRHVVQGLMEGADRRRVTLRAVETGSQRRAGSDAGTAGHDDDWRRAA